MERHYASSLQHQQEHSFGSLTFFSNFDSGNLLEVTKISQAHYELQIAADAQATQQSHYRVWFYFGIRGLARGQSIRLSLTSLTRVKAFTSMVYRPVFRELPSNPVWQRLPTDCRFDQGSVNRLTWSYQVSGVNQEVYFAFAPPYSYEDMVGFCHSLSSLVSPKTYFHQEVLTHSPDRRAIHLLTLTDGQNVGAVQERPLPHLFPEGPRSLQARKPIVMLTCRVHPGETPASYFLEAFLQFLLSADARAEALRKAFVFKVVPMLNTDGVCRGHFRVDQFGVNLNRSYGNPCLQTEPAIFAVRSYIEYLHSTENGLRVFTDIHAQSSTRACWLFGNSLRLEEQVENLLFPTLLGLNSAYFDYNRCDFSERSMHHKDPKDLHSKEGSARVAVYKSTGLVHSYTLECPYYCPQPLFRLGPVNARARSLASPQKLTHGVPAYNKAMFRELAEGFGVALLDYCGVNPTSRLSHPITQSLNKMKKVLRNKLMLNDRIKQSKETARTHVAESRPPFRKLV